MVKIDFFDIVVVGTFNINSNSSTLDIFELMVTGLLDVTIVTKKIDKIFPEALFCGFSIPYRLDRNNKRGRMIYVTNDTPSKMLIKHKLPEDIEAAFIVLIAGNTSGYCA